MIKETDSLNKVVIEKENNSVELKNDIKILNMQLKNANDVNQSISSDNDSLKVNVESLNNTSEIQKKDISTLNNNILELKNDIKHITLQWNQSKQQQQQQQQ